MPQNIQEVRVECHTALGPDTPILVDDKIINMRQLHLGYSGKNVKSFATNPNKQFTVDECRITEVPQEVFVPYTVKIGFASGFHFECTPGSLIATQQNGFVPVETLEKGSKVCMILFNSESGEFFYDAETAVTEIDKSTDSTLQVPVYLFISEFKNILLPYYKEGSNMIGFINLKQ